MWIHFDDNLDKLVGDVKQVTITNGGTSNASFVFNMNKGGKEKELNIFLNGVHMRTRYDSKYDQINKTEDFIAYSKISTPNNPLALKSETINGVYKYDDKGRIIQYVNAARKSADSCIYRYNDFGDLIECDEFERGQFFAKKKFKYNSQHLIIESLDEFAEGKSGKATLAYQYKTFDSMGNWLVRDVLNDGKRTTITREITYY